MPINPVQFAHQICDEFLRYLFSAFPLTDPALKEQFKALLARPSSLDIPLVKGPYITLSEAFAQGEPVRQMSDSGLLHGIMPDLIGYPRMWLHQQRVFEAVRGREHVLVSTGTGSGKTEAFLYPIVDDLLRQRDQGNREGLTAVLVYPMNALANDQLDRLREMLGGTGITFGQWVGTTPDSESDVKVERFNGSARQAYLAERKRRREQAVHEDRAVRVLAPPEECCSEADIRKRKPRILLTNYRQLELLATRWPDISLFANAPLKYLVFDEAHSYDGAAGAEVACLIRRVRALARKSPDEVICIGTSATLTDPEKKTEENEQTARRFASRFFGVAAEKVAVVGESYVTREWPTHRHKPAASPGGGMARLGDILKALTEPVDIPALQAAVEELTEQSFVLGGNWQETLFDQLLANEYVYQATQILKQPRTLDEAGWLTSQRVQMDRLPQGDTASAEMLCYLVLGAAARKGTESLLRPKVHFFIRGLDEMVVALDGKTENPQARLHMSLADAKEQHGERRDDAFLPVLTCRNCGQHFFERHYAELEFQRGANNRLKGFGDGNATEDGNGNENAVWSCAPKSDGKRLLLTDRLLEEAETGAGSTKSSRWPRVWLCRMCGAMHRNAADRCLADGCGNEQVLLPLMAFGDTLSSCPSCGTNAYQIGGRTIEPARKVRAVTVSDVHILAQAMINAAPEGHQKLIIFTDSRQEAAFQAGWMQDHARRIRLRHMMFQSISGKAESLSLDAIADRLMAIFRKERRLIETLLPELTGEEAQAVFGHDVRIATYRALRYMVLREFTTGVRRTDCLESMALVRISYRGLSSKDKTLLGWANMLEISPEEAISGVTLLLDIWRRNRILFVANDPVFSRYHAKDDPYIQAGLLPLREFRPEGLLLNAMAEDKYARGFLAQRGASAVQALIKKWAKDPEQIDTDEAATMLWSYLTRETGVFAQVTLRSSKEKPLQRDVWQVDADRVLVELSAQRVRCTTCQRIMTRTAPQAACTQHNCRGTTVPEAPDQGNYDVALMQRPFVMVAAEEHTAQVPGETRLAIEQDFKSRNGRTNCLVATPTLEMGVNIGALDMALMRNVPPRSSNYWQRAGRAGREERMAVVVTYCQRSQHDRYFFDDPLRLLGGAIEAPAFNLRNPLMVEKHIRSAILSELVLRGHGGGPDAQTTLDTLKALFPTFIRDYLLDEEDHFRDSPTSTALLSELLAAVETELCDQLVALFTRHWPPEAQDLTDRPAIQRTIKETSQALDAVLHRLHRRLDWARRTRAELHRKKDSGLIEREEEQLLRRCEEFINRIVRRDRSTYGLTVLGVEGFLPGYGVYEGGVTASARRGFAQHGGPRSFDLSRSNVVALREFIPGNRLYANRGSFYVARYHLEAEETSAVRTLRVDVAKGSVTDHAGTAAYGHTGGVAIDALPIADLDLAHESRISEDEQLRFAMPVLTLGRLRRRNRGGRALRVGDQDVLHLRGQGIELVNVGEAGRAKAGEFGHLICSVCGAAKTPYAVLAEINHFIEVHKERCGKEPRRLALTAEADVDVLQFVCVGSEQRAVNIGESLRAAAMRLLDMGEDDLQLLIVQKPDETTDLLVYDPMPGGSGLLEQMLARWSELIMMARSVLADCPMQCESSCYSCLKSYRNQFHHDLLDRHIAIELLAAIDHDPVTYRAVPPVFEEESSGSGTPTNTREAQLYRLLRENHFPAGKCREPVRNSAGLTTTPDWLHPESKTAIYLDGMSRNLHGDPRTAQRDQLIRQMLELDGYAVIVIQSRDLDDPEAMRRHLSNISRALRPERSVDDSPSMEHQ